MLEAVDQVPPHASSYLIARGASKQPKHPDAGSDMRRRWPRDIARPLPPWFTTRQRLLFADLGINHDTALRAHFAALRHGSDLASELITAGMLDEDRFGEIIARHLSLTFEPIAEGDRIIDPAAMLQRSPPRLLKICNDRLDGRIFIRPTIECLDAVASYLARWPRISRIIRVTSGHSATRAIDRQTAAKRYRAARLSFSADMPRLSARTVIEPMQAVIALILVATTIALFAITPAFAFVLAHVVATGFFAASIAFRLPAIHTPHLAIATHEALPEPGVLETEARAVPVYSVLAALHHETAVVTTLVAALDQLDWPKSRLDIKLICEADDAATTAAVSRAIAGKPQFSLVVVPPGEPRTKPKALNYALPLAHGEFLVLYDAEDAPDPAQLREAYLRFRTGPSNLACLQAPLVVTNGDAHWLAALFAFEYAAHFRKLLPWLAHRGLPLPLGGTSNHFIRQHLVDVGGWDSHNVTEDADLGIRLARAGFRIGTLTRPTYEHAPERWGVWHRQRTRWMKGWFITYLLHMRQPRLLYAQLGLRATVVFQLLFLNMLLSSLAHPLLFLCLIAEAGSIAAGYQFFAQIGWLLWLDIFNVIAAYGLFVVLSAVAMEPKERRGLQYRYLWLPAYWILLALASLRAVLHLVTDPHNWEKTPHGLESRADHDAHRHRVEPFLGETHFPAACGGLPQDAASLP
ncbi:glycosyltransferase [Jiella sp. MQZ9-1]|uniref:Glycosyltransferase n=1 Tax=Jiella flava TaxID=2816857 RepID=A0A939FYR1_9HYPH|nr:glycosyltransferase family 2 protein [Jiella flava]MBO0663942.1 glycosyltransferase [Jiella flava]MCD2472514.1 glycosyltransferase [Jiella flava]